MRNGLFTCLASFFAVGSYLVAAPWAFVFDYDLFLGDVVLGGTFGELAFLPFPGADPLSAIGLSIAGVSTAVLVRVFTWMNDAQAGSQDVPASAGVDIDDKRPSLASH